MTKGQSRKYRTEIPRKTQSMRWFDILETLHKESVKNRGKWQGKGVRSVSGWVVKTPKGTYLPSTFSVSRHSAMKKLLESAFQRFTALASSFFEDYEALGYRLVRVKWTEMK